jgi:hypothetical protein
MKRIILMVGVLAGLVVALMPRPQQASATVVAVPLRVAAFDCDVKCTHPGDCESGWHDAYDSPEPNATRNGGAHLDFQCREYTCDVRHGPLCGGGTEITSVDIEDLRRSLARNDVGAVRAVVAKHEARIKVNAPRSAVQVLSCAGDVIAHFPMSDETTARLVSYTDE